MKYSRVGQVVVTPSSSLDTEEQILVFFATVLLLSISLAQPPTNNNNTYSLCQKKSQTNKQTKFSQRMRETQSEGESNNNNNSGSWTQQPPQALLERLKDYGQEDAFALWDELSADERSFLVKDIEVISFPSPLPPPLPSRSLYISLSL